MTIRNAIVLISLFTFIVGVFIGAVWYQQFGEKSAPSPEPSSESSKVLGDVSSALNETQDGWAECTEQRKEDVKILKVCTKSLGECVELLERAVE